VVTVNLVASLVVINYGCKDRLFLPTSTKPIGSSDTSVITLNFSPLIRSLYLLFLSPFLPRISQQMTCDDFFFCHFGEEVNGSVISFRRQVFFIFVRRRLGQPQDGRRKMEYAAAYDGYPVPVASNRNQSSWRGRVWANRCDRLFQKPGLRNWADHEKKRGICESCFQPFAIPERLPHRLAASQPSAPAQPPSSQSSPLCFLVGESLAHTRCKL
jgi:hypothetical protein